MRQHARWMPRLSGVDDETAQRSKIATAMELGLRMNRLITHRRGLQAELGMSRASAYRWMRDLHRPASTSFHSRSQGGAARDPTARQASVLVAGLAWCQACPPSSPRASFAWVFLAARLRSSFGHLGLPLARSQPSSPTSLPATMNSAFRRSRWGTTNCQAFAAPALAVGHRSA